MINYVYFFKFDRGISHLSACWLYLPDTDDIVSVSSEEGGSIGRPGHGDALRSLFGIHDGRFEFIHKVFQFQVPNLNGSTCSNTQPVPIGREAKSIDDVIVIQCVQMLPFVQVPQHGTVVLPT